MPLDFLENRGYMNQADSPLSQAILEESERFEFFYLWLEKSMPKIFFNEVPKEWIPLIVHSLMSLKMQDFFSEIHFKNAAISLCLDHPEADVRILENYPLYGIKNYTTYISKEVLPYPEVQAHLRIAITYFTEANETHEEPLSEDQREDLKKALIPRLKDYDNCDALLDRVDARFLRKLPKELQISALELLARAQTRDHCQYEVQYIEDWKEKNSPSMRLILAWRNTPKHNFLYRFARVVFQHGLTMQRVNATYIDPYKTDSILILSLGLHGSDGRAANEAANIADFLQEIVTLKYFGSLDNFDRTFVKTHLLSGNMVNWLRTTMNFIHQVLVSIDPHLYSLEHISEDLCRHPELTVKLCEAFEYKFHPQKNSLSIYEKARTEFYELVDQLDTGNEFYDLRRKHILRQGMNFIHHTLKTNFYKTNKTAFAFRLDPKYLDDAPFDRKTLFPELPFGIFFIKGMHFFSFHIRFKDLSRGGLRTVFPEKKERMVAERNNVFIECYNLAYTQHKKNKDIPEGGAKGVIFLKPYERLASEADILAYELSLAGFSKIAIEKRIAKFKEEQKLEYLYETQRSFVKNFLTLINCEADGTLRSKDIVDYYQKPEYIYLGPDENMHDVMIEWIAKTSKEENYKPGGAFISGKPTLGINHKEYGVTSLGVNVCMHEALKCIHLHPDTDLFTVKMTGGPDGDVAGNQILNLYRYYPKTAKLVALTDVSGTIHDPHGLDLEACTQLFRDGKSIRHYPPEKLSTGGFLLDRQTKREPSPYISQTLCWRNKNGTIVEDWLSGNDTNALYRNNVHQTQADVFIPCGGRPKTLGDNYKDFFDKSGQPTAKIIIEGANLYLSPFARRHLEEKGVLIIKDSSANKCGVICSSFEILCGLSLKDEEFLINKSQLVSEILERLRKCAYDEASLLIKTHKETGVYMTELSDTLSERINFFTDQLLSYLEGIQLPKDPAHPLVQCFLSYCLKFLRENYSGRLLMEIPDNHKKAIIASHIAARLVYYRGLKWQPTLVDSLPLILKDENLFN